MNGKHEENIFYHPIFIYQWEVSLVIEREREREREGGGGGSGGGWGGFELWPREVSTHRRKAHCFWQNGYASQAKWEANTTHSFQQKEDKLSFSFLLLLNSHFNPSIHL